MLLPTGVSSLAKTGSTKLLGDVTLTGGTNVTLTQSGNDISIAASGGGGSGDMLGDLSAAEIAVTGAVTATISRMHRISGTSADYTITLPAASGNTGKFIGFRVLGAAAASKLYTLDGNSSETIDGSTTRILWAEESCILYCDGSNWFKVAGKSRAMQCTMHLSANQTGVATATMTKVNLDATDSDNTGLMADTGNSRMTIRRTGTYIVVGVVSISLGGSASERNITQLRKDTGGGGTQISFAECSATTGGNPVPHCTAMISWTAGNFVEVAGYHNKGSNASFTGGALADGASQLNVIESPTW